MFMPLVLWLGQLTLPPTLLALNHHPLKEGAYVLYYSCEVMRAQRLKQRESRLSHPTHCNLTPLGLKEEEEEGHWDNFNVTLNGYDKITCKHGWSLQGNTGSKRHLALVVVELSVVFHGVDELRIKATQNEE